MAVFILQFLQKYVGFFLQKVCFMKFKFLLMLVLFLAYNYCNAQSSVTGCLTDGDSRLYPNPIGNRFPYTGVSVAAYNGTPYVVDNRNFSDVLCDTYYIYNKGGTDCVIYNSTGTVFQGQNGKISVIRLKICNLPLDDYSGCIMAFSAVIGVFFLRKNFYSGIAKS
jgi:hypothetical protein